jgi:hypothetical protein
MWLIVLIEKHAIWWYDRITTGGDLERTLGNADTYQLCAFGMVEDNGNEVQNFNRIDLSVLPPRDGDIRPSLESCCFYGPRQY